MQGGGWFRRADSRFGKWDKVRSQAGTGGLLAGRAFHISFGRYWASELRKKSRKFWGGRTARADTYWLRICQNAFWLPENPAF